MTQNKTKDIVILYHAECPDGFAGCYAAWKKFGNKADYISVYHNTTPPPEVYGKNVYTIDYSYPLPVVQDLLTKTKSLTIIDHHVSNVESVKLAGGVIDMNHSGGVLAWQYFFPDKKLPELYKNVEDIDLWKFKLPFTNEIAEITSLLPLDFKVWTKLIHALETKSGLKKYVNEGRLLIKKRDDQVEKLANYAEVVSFEGYKCYMINSPVYTSHVGNYLVKKMPPIALIWSRRGNKIVVSLRGDGSVDVAKLAEKYGGGGHKSAAGFSWEEEEFLKFRK